MPSRSPISFAAPGDDHPHSRARGDLSRSRLRVRRDGEPALYRSRLLEDAIATVTKIYGIWIGIGGVFAGGIAVLRLGLMPALLIGGIAAAASHLAFAWLALAGAPRLDLLTLAIGVESFASGFAGTALIAFMSSLTSPAYAAAQYALLSSLYALPGKLVGGRFRTMGEHVRLPRLLRRHVRHRHPGGRSRLYVCEAPAGRGGTEAPLPAPGGSR